MSITKTADHEHKGYGFKISITKSPVGTYKAVADVQLPGRSVTISFPQEGSGGLPEKGIPCLSGSYLEHNPYEFIADYCRGVIDGSLALLADVATQQPGAKDTLKQITREDTMSMRPKTNATDEQIKQMRDATDRLFERFGGSGLVHLSGQSPATVNNWNYRGRVSATQAHELCALDVVKAAGFTREELRPDVPSWVQMDYPAAVK